MEQIVLILSILLAVSVISNVYLFSIFTRKKGRKQTIWRVNRTVEKVGEEMKLNANEEEYKALYDKLETERLAEIQKQYEKRVEEINRDYEKKVEQEKRDYERKLEERQKAERDKVEELGHGPTVIDAAMYSTFGYVQAMSDIARQVYEHIKMGAETVQLGKNAEEQIDEAKRELSGKEREDLTNLKYRVIDSEKAVERYKEKAQNCGLFHGADRREYKRQAEFYQKRAQDALEKIKERGFDGVSDLDRKLANAEKLIEESKNILKNNLACKQAFEKNVEIGHNAMREYNRAVEFANRELSDRNLTCNQVENTLERVKDLERLEIEMRKGIENCPAGAVRNELERQLYTVEQKKLELENQIKNHYHDLRDMDFSGNSFVDVAQKKLTNEKIELSKNAEQVNGFVADYNQYEHDVLAHSTSDKAQQLYEELHIKMNEEKLRDAESDLRKLAEQEQNCENYVYEMREEADSLNNKIDDEIARLKEKENNPMFSESEKSAIEKQIKELEEMRHIAELMNSGENRELHICEMCREEQKHIHENIERSEQSQEQQQEHFREKEMSQDR